MATARSSISLNDQIAAYEAVQDELESEHFGEWVVFHGGSLHGTYDSFQAAADQAVRNYGRGPYLIRRVGAPPERLPTSVQFKPVDAHV